MNSIEIADIELKTIVHLTGMPTNKDIINPKIPSEMAKRVRVTFRPLPIRYNNEVIINFREKLEEMLIKKGVNVLPWDEVSEIPPNSLISRVFRFRKVKSSIHAVIDVKRNSSPLRKFMSGIAERIYRFVRSPDRSVMEILKISGWADDFTARYVQDPFNTQIITLMPLDPEFADGTTTYDKKIAIGIKNLVSTMSELVIGVSDSKFSLTNMNLSDSTFGIDNLESFVLNSLIPKIYAPIKPPVLTRFEKSEFDPRNYDYAQQLSNLGKKVRSTDLFPEGSKFSEKISRLSHRDVVEKILDGRTGVSYGFIAIAEAPLYHGSKLISESEWNQLSEVEGYSFDNVRRNSSDNWYVKTYIMGSYIYQQVPGIWIVTSRSGCDKTNLDPNTDVVRIGLVKGKLYLQTPKGVDLKRKDIRPSFDTFVILAQAVAASFYMPELIKDGMPIIHFHGYPDPKWFEKGEYFAGAGNPSLPCGTVEAAILNYSAIYEMANTNGSALKLLCLVESDHGVNIMGIDRDYIVHRLQEGKSEGHVLLGGTFLPYLKRESLNQVTQ